MRRREVITASLGVVPLTAGCLGEVEEALGDESMYVDSDFYEGDDRIEEGSPRGVVLQFHDLVLNGEFEDAREFLHSEAPPDFVPEDEEEIQDTGEAVFLELEVIEEEEDRAVVRVQDEVEIEESDEPITGEWGLELRIENGEWRIYAPSELPRDPDEEAPSGSIEFRDQTTDGTYITVSEISTEDDAMLGVRNQDASERVYRDRVFEAGDYRDYEIELDDTLTESAELAISLYPQGGGSGFARDVAHVTVKD